VSTTHGAVLRINPVSARRDDGLIECVAENGLGDPATASATLQVYPEGLGKLTSLLLQVLPIYRLHVSK